MYLCTLKILLKRLKKENLSYLKLKKVKRKNLDNFKNLGINIPNRLSKIKTLNAFVEKYDFHEQL